MTKFLPIGLSLTFLLGATILLGACQTTAGAGRDLSNAGRDLTGAAVKSAP
jgi:predicted small secreted protein